VRFLASHDFGVIDCQMNTPYLASLGAREIPRAQFAALLDRLTGEPGVPGRWSINQDSLAAAS
jgi:leucyl/phenylalanyl-tRNA--protein transferase